MREWATVALLSAEKVEFIVVTRRRRRPTLAGQLFSLQLAIIVVVLIAVAGVSLAQAGATFERVEGRRVAGLAEQVAVNPLVRANLAEPETRTGLATFAQSVVTQTGVSSVTFAETDLDVRVSTDPSIENSRMTRARPGVETGASWSGTLEIDGVDHLVSQVPVLGESADAVGAHLGTVMVAERVPVDVGAAAGHLVVPAHLSRHRTRCRTRWVLAAVSPDQAPDPGAGTPRDRRPRRAPRGDAARHRRGCRRPSTPSTASRWSTRSPASSSTCPEHAIGTSIEDLRIEGRLREVLVGENFGSTSDVDPDDHVTAARDEVVIRRGPGARHEHHAGRQR